MRQYTLQMKPLPPPPPPEDNVFFYAERITEVEEYYDEDEVLHERPSAKEIITRKFYCEYAEFNHQGYCTGGCDTDADKAYCMDIQKINNQPDSPMSAEEDTA